jgi:hypothetical protein
MGAIELYRNTVEDSNSNENFKRLFESANKTFLGSLTATEINKVDAQNLYLGCIVYDSTNNVVKVLVLDGGTRTFKTITVS